MSHKGRKSADEVLLQALACGATQKSAAEKAGISERTVARRLQDPKFLKCLQTRRAEMVERTASALTAASMEAVKGLLELMRSDDERVRLGAIRTILEHSTRLREESDLAQRVARLEEGSPNAVAGPPSAFASSAPAHASAA
jgi:hypothetical protein